MGLFPRKTASSRPDSEGEATGMEMNPEADLKKFKKLHKWDPFMEIEKLDAADE